ncbi:MAG: hypothetical protein ACRDGQ_04980, partial [Candidatus Limnocylindrales bacterium]
MAAGDFAIAESFIDRLPDGRTWPIFDIVLSRMELHRGRPTEAVRLAESAVTALRADPGNPVLDQALANLTSVYYQAGQIVESVETATDLCDYGRSESLVTIGRAMLLLIDASMDGPIGLPLAHLRAMADAQQLQGDLHYYGITQINIGELERARGNAQGALEAAEAAMTALNASSAGYEMGAARLLKAWALAHHNEIARAMQEIDIVLGSTFDLVRDEARFEVASLLLEYG